YPRTRNDSRGLAAVFFPAPGDADGGTLATATGAFEDELVHLELDGHRVFAGEAGGAEAVLRLLHSAHETFDREVGEAIGADVLPDLVDLLLGGDEFPLRRHIDAEA